MTLLTILDEFTNSKEQASLTDEQYFQLHDLIKRKSITTEGELIYEINICLTENNKIDYSKLNYPSGATISSEVSDTLSSTSPNTNIKMVNNWNVEVTIPKIYEEYWNLVVVDRIGLQKKLKDCKSQDVFEIKLKDEFESFNNLNEADKELYLS